MQIHKLNFNFFIIMLFVFFSQSAYSQSNFKNGYIIKNNGDTLYGLINDVGSNYMCKNCKFKKSKNDIEQNFSPKDLNSFRINNGRYFITNKLNDNLVFIEKVISGKLNIYYFEDLKNNKYFLSKEVGKLEEIPYKEGIIEENGKNYFQKTNKHIGILKYHTQDAPELGNMIEKIDKPTHKNLIALSKEYQKITQKNKEYIVYNEKIWHFKMDIEPIIGVNTIINHSNFVSSSYLQYGAITHFWLPELSENFYVRTGLKLSYIKAKDLTNTIFYKIPMQLEYVKELNKNARVKAAFGFSIFNPTSFSADRSLNEGLSFNNYIDLSLSGMFGFERKISKNLKLGLLFDFDMQNIHKIRVLNFRMIDNSFSIGLLYSLK